MDGPPAQSLGVEAVDHDVMRLPPRPSDEPIITRPLLARVGMAAAIICTGTLGVFWSEYGGPDADEASVRHDTTMTFTTFVMFDMFFALACRSATKSVLTLGLTSNPMFLAAVGASLTGQLGLIYVPPLQAVFQTVALSAWDWVRILGVTSTVLVADELRKALAAALAPPPSATAAAVASQGHLRSAAGVAATRGNGGMLSSVCAFLSRKSRQYMRLVAAALAGSSRAKLGGGATTNDGVSSASSSSGSATPVRRLGGVV
jgi:hypothetical protein